MLRVGVALIALGLIWDAAWNFWADTHNWVPLLSPIALSAGYRTSAQFEIDTPGTYFVALGVHIPDAGSDYPCFVSDICPTNRPVIGVAWSVSRNGRTMTSGGSTRGGVSFPSDQYGDYMARELGTFFAEPGKYTIAFSALKDGNEYASARPKLAIFETGAAQRAVTVRLEVALRLGGAAIFSGALLFLAAAAGAHRKRQARLSRYDSLTEPGPMPHDFQWGPQPAAFAVRSPVLRKEPSIWAGIVLLIGGLTAIAHTRHRIAAQSFAPLDDWLSLLAIGAGASLLLIARKQGRSYSPAPIMSEGPSLSVISRAYWKPRRGLRPAQLPAFGLLGANVVIVLVSIMSVAQSFDHFTSTGLRVRLLNPLVNIPRMIGIEPVLVRLQFTRYDALPAVYIGSRSTSWEDFDAVIMSEIRSRPLEWPIYLQGDPELDWKSVAQAIDRIRGLDAEVILLTRNPPRPQ